jgi:hypothetical protein
MDHAYYKDRISAYFDGALPPYEQKAVEDHLAQCAECREILEKFRALDSLVAEKSGLGESDYWEQQAQATEQRLGIGQTEVTHVRPTRAWQGLTWKLTAAAASIAVVGVIGFYSWESIREKTERPPVEMAPSIPPASVATPRQVRPEPEKAPDKGTPGEATEAEKESVVSMRRIADTQNYRTPAVMGKPAAGEVQETANRAEIEKTGTVTQETLKPVQRVDELLKSAAAEKIRTDSGVFIRGGRAGEVSYLVDSGAAAQSAVAASKPALNVVAPASAAGETRPESIVITRDEALSDMAPRAPVADSAMIADSLAYWLAQEKALAGGRIAKGKSAPLSQNFGAREKATLQSALADRRDSTDIQLRLLVVYYQIARLSRDSSEVSLARTSLLRLAEDTKSPYQKTAKAYLDSLGIK